MSPNKITIGFIEDVTIHGHTTRARIDTGATTSSIDAALSKRLQLGPPVDERTVISAQGKHVRPVVEAEVTLKGRTLKAQFTVVDREHMTYPVLIGRNILNEHYIIDPGTSSP
jgi:hypothetical protein